MVNENGNKTIFTVASKNNPLEGVAGPFTNIIEAKGVIGAEGLCIYAHIPNGNKPSALFIWDTSSNDWSIISPEIRSTLPNIPTENILTKMESSSSVKYMKLNDFYNKGFLQELNRQFLHPLGLALEMTFDGSDNATGFGGVWDYTADDEGMLFADSIMSSPETKRKAEYVTTFTEIQHERRKRKLGFVVQPLCPEL